MLGDVYKRQVLGVFGMWMTWLVIRQMIVEGLHEKLYQMWVENASLLGWFSGNVQDAREARWIGPGFQHIQPREAAMANDMAVKARTKTRSQIIREAGFEPKEVFEELAKEEEMLRDLGLSTGAETEPDDPDDSTDGDEDGDEDDEGNLKESKLAASLELRNKIRAEHAAGASHRQLAAKYGVGKTPIASLLNGHTFKTDDT